MLDIIIFIVTTVFTYAMGKISKRLKWNESLPIPVQNIIIGIVVFVIFYLIKRPAEIETLAQQIFVAMGGVGTATLGYDTTKIKKGE